MDRTDLARLPRNDQGVLACGVLAFIASFFPYYGASFHAGSLGNYSASVNAWHGWALVGMLLVIAATLVAAVQLFSPQSLPEAPTSWNVVVTALAGLGTVCVVLRSFTLPGGSGLGVDYGLRWGAFVLMIVCIAQVVFAVQRVRAAGDSWSWGRPGGAAAPPAA